MMRIREQSPARLVLSGVPGGVLWMILLVGLGTLLSAVVGVLAVWIWQESGGLVWSHAPLALGLLIAQVLFWTGVVTLAVGRLALVLDKAAGVGEYRVRSPIIDAGTSCRFRLQDVHGVALQTSHETRPRDNSTATVHRVCLRLSKPRQSITLDETEHGRRERLETLAQAVARFLDVPVAHVDETPDDSSQTG